MTIGLFWGIILVDRGTVMKFYVYNTKRILFEVELLRSITIVAGDSGSGKTYLTHAIQSEDTKIKGCLKTDFCIINAFTTKPLEKLKNTNAKITILDNTNLYLTESAWQYIKEQKNRFFIIYTRNYPKTCVITPNSLSIFQEENGTRKLCYLINNASWEDI